MIYAKIILLLQTLWDVDCTGDTMTEEAIFTHSQHTVCLWQQPFYLFRIHLHIYLHSCVDYVTFWLRRKRIKNIWFWSFLCNLWPFSRKMWVYLLIDPRHWSPHFVAEAANQTAVMAHLNPPSDWGETPSVMSRQVKKQPQHRKKKHSCYIDYFNSRDFMITAKLWSSHLLFICNCL